MLQQSIRRLLPSGILNGQTALCAKQSSEMASSTFQDRGFAASAVPRASSPLPHFLGDLRRDEQTPAQSSLKNSLPMPSTLLMPRTASMRMPFGLSGSGLLSTPRQMPMVPRGLNLGTSPHSMQGVRSYGTEGELVASAYLLTTDIMFWSGLIGAVVFRRNLIVMLLCTEIVMLACNMNFMFASAYLNDMTGVIMSITITTIAACETAIGLALCVTYFHLRSATDVEALNLLK